MENSREASFSGNRSHGSPNPPRGTGGPHRGTEAAKPRVVWVQPRGRSALRVTACVAVTSTIWGLCGLIHKRKFL